MRRILMFLYVVVASFLLKSQPIDLQKFYPENHNKNLWNLANTLFEKPNATIADSILSVAYTNIAKSIEFEGNLFTASQIALYFGTKENNLSKFKTILDELEVLISQIPGSKSYATANFYRIKASYYSQTKNSKKLLETFNQAYDILLEVSSTHPAKPVYELNLMQAHFFNRNVDSGFVYFDSLVKYGIDNHKPYYLANAYLGAANIIKFYNPHLAVKFFDHAYAVALECNDTTFLNDPFFYISIGSGQTAVDAHKKALDFYVEGLKVLNNKPTSNQAHKSAFYYYIGVSHKNTGNNDKAVLFLDSALAFEIKNSQSYYRILNIKGQTLNNAKRYTEALPINIDVLNYYIEAHGLNNTYFTQHGISEVSRSYQGVGNLDSALYWAHKGVCYFLESSDTLDVFSVPHFAHHVTGKKNYMSLEYALYRKIEILEDIFKKEKQEVLLQHIIAHFEAAQKASDISLSLSQTTEAAYDISNRYKHHTNKLLNFVFENNVPLSLRKSVYTLAAKSKAFSMVAEELQKSEKHIETVPTIPYKKQLAEQLLYQNNSKNTKAYLAISEKLLELEIDEFLKSLNTPKTKKDFVLPSFLDLHNPDLLSSINEKTIIIDYYITKTALHAFVFTNTHFYTVTNALTPQFENDITALFKALKLSEAQNLAQVSMNLWAMLFKDIDFKDKEHLIIIPDEKLFIIPFEVLLAHKPGIYEKLSVCYRYTSHIYTKPKDSLTENMFMAFAPIFENNQLADIPDVFRHINNNDLSDDIFNNLKLVPLFHSMNEVMDISSIYKNKHIPVHIFANKNAKKTTFKQYAHQAGILHIATHGISDSENIDMSGLFFQSETQDNNFQDVFLSLHEIRNMQFNADLVVLSACKSGYGAILRGEGIMGLSRAFINAGAKNVLASLWKIHDKKTYEFMLLFYTFLSEGYDYAEALKLTKIKCKAMDWAPIDWAGFILIGA